MILLFIIYFYPDPASHKNNNIIITCNYVLDHNYIFPNCSILDLPQVFLKHYVTGQVMLGSQMRTQIVPGELFSRDSFQVELKQ